MPCGPVPPRCCVLELFANIRNDNKRRVKASTAQQDPGRPSLLPPHGPVLTPHRRGHRGSERFHHLPSCHPALIGGAQCRDPHWELTLLCLPLPPKGSRAGVLPGPCLCPHRIWAQRLVGGGFKSVSQIDSDIISHIVLSVWCSEWARGGAMLFGECGGRGLAQWDLSSSCL